ncbi:mitochondrial ubiquitin ligase activator of nfkb 1-A isoform X2 [Genypterus blacodes]
MEEFPVTSIEAVCVGASFAISGLFYYVYWKKRKAIDKLSDAPHLTLDGKLKDILDVTPGKCLQYAVIEGTVQPIGTPLRSQFQEECVGVIQKFMLREHKLVWNGFARTWTDSERVLYQTVNSAPFTLVGLDEAKVRVLGPLEASGLQMEITHEKFHQATFGFTDMLGQYLSGEKPKGQLETEEMLKVGCTLTGVGELILDTDRTLALRPPSDGSEYFLTAADFDTLRAEQVREAVAWQVFASIFALAGAAVLFWAGRRYYCKLKVRWEQERQRREFQTLQGDGPRLRTASESSEDGGPVENSCVICLSQPRECVLLNCGHVCCCLRCYQALPQPTCPICRQTIDRVVPIYQA